MATITTTTKTTFNKKRINSVCVCVCGILYVRRSEYANDCKTGTTTTTTITMKGEKVTESIHWKYYVAI